MIPASLIATSSRRRAERAGRVARWPRCVAACGLALLWTLATCSPGAAWAMEPQKVLASARKMGPATLRRAQLLIDEIDAATTRDELARLKAINDFFNRQVDYATDLEVWGQIDYWASPLETLDKGRGDCEDYAIGKYFSLIAAGVPGAKMRLVYVRAEVGQANMAHMVLAYYGEPGAEPLILDNLNKNILPASRRPDLAPVFSFNAEGLWQGVGRTTAGDPVARLSHWRGVLNRARAEGWW